MFRSSIMCNFLQRNFESGLNGKETAENYGTMQSAPQYEGSDGRCQCAKSRGVPPTCPAAMTAPRARRDAQQWDQSPMLGPPLQPFSQGTTSPVTFMCVCRPA